jgi:RNA polymerase sigma factor (sigma-70 family)
MNETEFAPLLVSHRPRLVRYFERRGGALLRQESADDLAQGVHLYALRHRDGFAYQGDRAFVGWLLRLARQHMARRIEYWAALKRDGGRMFRITFGAATSPGAGTHGVQPAAAAPGPITAAARAEQLDLAARALDGLPERDCELVRLMARDLSVKEIAQRLEVSEAAAQRARLRAIERFRKIYTILERQRE